MKLKVIVVLLTFFYFVNSAKVHSRQYVGGFKKEPLKISKSFRSRGEVMENLFIIFDPSFLAYVWPKIKNGVHLNIEPSCWDDVSVFLKDLAEGRSWAYRAADASGRYQSGLFEGRRFWLGSKEQCLLLDEKHKSLETNRTWGEFYSGDYLNALLRREKEFGGNIEEWHTLLQRDELMRRVVEADNEPPISVSYTALQIMLNVTKFTMPSSYEITLGLCLPRTCVAEDVVSIINFSIMLNDNLKSNKTVSRAIKITSLRHVESSYDIKTDIGAVTLILVTLSLVMLSIIATVVDLDLVKLKPYTATSFDLQQYNNDDRKLNGKKTNVLKPISVKDTKMETETLSMKNLNELKRAMREKAIPPSITLDVMAAEGKASCKRCGKYKKQCVNPMQMENVPPCPRVKYNSCASLTTEFKRKNGVWKNLLLSFSLKHSWMRIFNTTMANKDLAMVHALKIIAVLWIIFVHVSVTVDSLAENGGDVNDYNNVYYILSTGTLAFDTLFFVSGLFSAQHFFYLKSRYSEELVKLGGICGQSLQLLCFITNRAIRLLPTYMYATFLTSILSRVSRDTAVLSLPERDYDTCDSYWWRNLLYITTLYPKEEQCMQVSWYLSAETQMHMFGALLCLLLANKKRRTSAVLAVTVLLGATAYDVVTAYSDYGQRVPNAFVLYSVIINRPWSRVVPYCAGVLAGWLLHVADGQCCVSTITSYCFWIATVVTITASLTLPLVDTSWITAWVHLTWPVALLWPALVCATKYSEWSRRVLCSAAASGASRLCWPALLLHGAAARAALLAADAALCSRLACLICYFAGSTLVTLVGALCLSLLIEMPGCCLLRRISDYTYR
nr:uncharacterized protein LOC113404503 [Vanessa tameamea]